MMSKTGSYAIVSEIPEISILTGASAESKSSWQWKTNRDFHCRSCKRLARQILPFRIS